jgi:hypothetical protein
VLNRDVVSMSYRARDRAGSTGLHQPPPRRWRGLPTVALFISSSESAADRGRKADRHIAYQLVQTIPEGQVGFEHADREKTGRSKGRACGLNG